MSVVKSWAAKKRIEAALKELRTLLTREDVNTAVVKDQFEKLTVVRQMIIDDAVRTMWSKVALTVLDIFGLHHDEQSISKPPYTGKLIVCLFVPLEKQEDRLADFEEKLSMVWIPHFGNSVGRLVYVWHAIRSAGSIVRIGLVAAIIDRVTRACGW
jgi:hypothetical protein